MHLGFVVCTELLIGVHFIDALVCLPGPLRRPGKNELLQGGGFKEKLNKTALETWASLYRGSLRQGLA
jgi:hypothetical protein